MSDSPEDEAAGPEKTEKKRRGLGRGLSALFEDEEPYPQAPDGGAVSGGEAPSGNRRTIDISLIIPNPSQPRRMFSNETLDELAASIARHGVLQPLLVRQRDIEGSTFYQIIAGERRWRAAQIAQVHEVPVVIRDDLDDEAAYEIALVENLQREDLDPIEEAEGYKGLIDRFGHSQEDVAAFIGKSRSHVSNMMRLLGLPANVRGLIQTGQISAGHARAIVTAKDPEALAKKIVAQGLNVRQTEKLVAAEAGRGKIGAQGESAQHDKSQQKDADTLALENEVSNVLGMKVSINVKPGDTAGSLSIEFKSLDQLDEVLHRLSHYPGSRVIG